MVLPDFTMSLFNFRFNSSLFNITLTLIIVVEYSAALHYSTEYLNLMEQHDASTRPVRPNK